MPQNGTNHYSLPTTDTLQQLDRYDEEFAAQIAFALRWIYSLLGWNGATLEKAIPGVKASVWQRYAQPAYPKSRSLHVVAALSWVSRVSMSAILYGDRIARYWPGVSRDLIEVFLYSGLMGKLEFHYFVERLLRDRPELAQFRRLSEAHFAEREPAHDNEYKAPEPLDIEAFGRDYYLSVAQMLTHFRTANGFSVADMAIALNISDSRYQKLEDVEQPPKAISLHLAARLKLAFKIPNTVEFLSHMRAYPGFSRARALQQDRELLLLALCEGLPEPQSAKLAKLAREIVKLPE